MWPLWSLAKATIVSSGEKEGWGESTAAHRPCRPAFPSSSVLALFGCRCRCFPVLGQGIAGAQPLRPLAGSFRETDCFAGAAGDIDQLQANVGWLVSQRTLVPSRFGVMCQALNSAIVETSRVVQLMRLSDFGHTVKTRFGGLPQERLVDDEFVIVVLVEASETAAVSADAVHARRRVGGELDPIRIERPELRMDDRAGESKEARFAPRRSLR